MSASNNQHGFTFIELLVFITVVGVISTGLFSAAAYLTQHSEESLRRQQVKLAAEERIELILGQKRLLGFDAFTATEYDPCKRSPTSNHAVCTDYPAGLVVDSGLQTQWQGNNLFKIITVSADFDSGERYELQTLVSDYYAY